jgi:plastocyanin
MNKYDRRYRKFVCNFQRICLTCLSVIAAIGFVSLMETEDRAIAEQHREIPMTCHSGLKCDSDNITSDRDDRSELKTPVTSATVTIESFQFTPNKIELKKGGKVTFINKDTTPHTVTPEMDSMFVGTGRLTNNESKTIVFDRVGVQNYFCEIHPSMTGQIEVVD